MIFKAQFIICNTKFIIVHANIHQDAAAHDRGAHRYQLRCIYMPVIDRSFVFLPLITGAAGHDRGAIDLVDAPALAPRP